MEVVTPLFQKVYVDSKLLTVSAHSWPSRHLGDIMASEIDLDEPFSPFEPSPEMFTYVNPNQHATFLHYIADHGRMQLAKELAEANAVWIIQDGSVDLTQIDNYFHMLRYVTKRGELKTCFLSQEEKLLLGANGQWDCLQRSLVSLYPRSGFVEPSQIIDILKEKHKNITNDSEETDVIETDIMAPAIDRMDAPF